VSIYLPTVREYVWLDDMPLAWWRTWTRRQLWYVHADHLDRPIKMTDDTKAVVWDAVFRPFVDHRLGVEQPALPGAVFLIEPGLHYNWHRHYDPRLGRYVQPDPLDLPDGPSLYSYVRGNPLGEIDPLGLLGRGSGRGPYSPGTGPGTVLGQAYGRAARHFWRNYSDMRDANINTFVAKQTARRLNVGRKAIKWHAGFQMRGNGLIRISKVTHRALLLPIRPRIPTRRMQGAGSNQSCSLICSLALPAVFGSATK
jgi:RHS repeat-associated protein